MAIVQISKIQQRAGNIVDLPQLDEAEFGFASDAKRLFIGKVSPNENIEVLTSYSNIAFDQLEGSVGNLDISAVSVDNGQVLTYDGTNWVNRGGAAGGLIDLGDVSNVSIGGGAIGYVLETDGLGNLSWTPKGTLYTNIEALSNATPIIMTVSNSVPYTNGTAVTISGVNGTANANVNGLTFYITLATDYATSGNVKLYTDTARTVAANGTNLTYTNANNAIATAVISGSGAGTGIAGGSNGTVQFNDSGVLNGVAGFAWSNATSTLTINGNANVGNLNATSSITGSTLTSNVATGTAPLAVTSTTRVANLNVNYANVSDFEVVTAQTTGTYYPAFVNNSATGNRALGANANLVFNAATGNLTSTILHATSTVTAIGNVTGGNVNTAGIVTASRLVSNVATGTAPLTVTSTTRVANLSVSYANVADFVNVADVSTGTFYPILANAASGNVSEGSNTALTFNAATGALNSTLLGGTLTTASQPNVTSLGTLASLTVTGTVTLGNIQTGGTAGDDLNIFGANATTLNDAGGNVNITAGRGNGTGKAGGVYVYAASTVSGNAAGGDAQLVAGAGTGQGQGGQTTLAAGDSANVNGGFGANIILTGGTYTGLGGNLVARAGSAYGTDQVGGTATISGGTSTGSAAPGKIVLQTSIVGSTGSTTQTLANRVIIDDNDVNVTFSTAATSTTSGALVVGGGVGVAGNVYASFFYGAGNGLSNIQGANVSGAVATATSATTAGTVTTNAQPNITSVGTLTALTTNSGTISALSAPILFQQTWNNSSIAFTAFKQNITDTASDAASRLMDLQVGGVSKLYVDKTGNVVATAFYGAGNNLSNIQGANVSGAVANATYAVSAGSATTATTAGTVTSNAQSNITSVGTLTSLAVSGDVTAGNLSVTTGAVTLGTLTTGANTTAGTITGNWSLSAGSRLNATYADLAEYYEADANYEPGTVLEFGGDKEVTIAEDGTNRVAGVVSSNPAYVMNSACPGNAVPIALQGRVPVKVRGTVRKGDMMIAGGNGFARPASNPQLGTIIGKALENFNDGEGMIEIAVGRL